MSNSKDTEGAQGSERRAQVRALGIWLCALCPAVKFRTLKNKANE